MEEKILGRGLLKSVRELEGWACQNRERTQLSEWAFRAGRQSSNFRLRRCALTKASLSRGAEIVANYQENEFAAVHQITPPKPARLVDKAKKPFKAVLAHPYGRLLCASRVNIERGADANHHGHVDAVAMVKHPALLLRRAEANPKNVGARGVDLRNEFAILGRGNGAKRRRDHSGDFQIRRKMR